MYVPLKRKKSLPVPRPVEVQSPVLVRFQKAAVHQGRVVLQWKRRMWTAGRLCEE